MKRILFITQNMNRTGSEMVLWYLLNNLDKESFKLYVFCISKGTMYDVLPDHINKSVFYKNDGFVKGKIWRKLLKLVGQDPLKFQLNKINKNLKPDYWYVNTLAIPEVYSIAHDLNVHVVTHLHELLYAFGFIKSMEFKLMLECSKTIIGCSDEVCALISNTGHKDVRRQFSFVDENSIMSESTRVIELKKLHGINEDDFVWVISGATTYMKGFDLILDLLEEFKDSNIKFLWIGRKINDGLNYYIESIANHKFKDKLILVGPQNKDYYNYMSMGNGLLMISKEESFSLVTIEAALLGLPTVGFNIGVAGSFIKDGMGQTVKQGDKEGLFGAMKNIHDIGHDADKLKTEAKIFSVRNQMLNYIKLLNEL